MSLQVVSIRPIINKYITHLAHKSFYSRLIVFQNVPVYLSNSTKNSQKLVASSHVINLIDSQRANVTSQALIIASLLHQWITSLHLVFKVLTSQSTIAWNSKCQLVESFRWNSRNVPCFVEWILSEPTWSCCRTIASLRYREDEGFSLSHLLWK